MYRIALAVVFLALAFTMAPGALRAQPTTILLSKDNSPVSWEYGSGNKGIGESIFLTADGRFTAFITDARNVFDNHDVPADLPVIAVYDAASGSVQVATVSANGSFPDGPSFAPTVTSDGRYVCFCSWASNLVPGDTNNQGDIFVRDMQSGVTRRVNVPYDGIWDQKDKSYCVTHAMTDDGRYVVFSTASSHMVPNDANDSDDVFMRDLLTNTTSLISVATGGIRANEGSVEPRIARNGRYVVFMSMATNLAPNTSTPNIRTFLRDTDASRLTTTLIGEGGVPNISSTGRYIVYTSLSMTGDDAQAYRYDVQTGQRVLCSVTPASVPGNRDSLAHGISDDGRYVCFTSKARNLVPDDTNDEADVFVRDLGVVPATTTRVSVAMDGLQGNRSSGNAAMSANGRFIAFTSATEDFVSLDTNEQPDVFLRGPMFAQSLSLLDAMSAMRIASGMRTVTATDTSLDVVQSATSSGRIDLLDAVRITRTSVGLN